MTTDNCTANIAEEKHGEFTEQNHVNVLLGSYFPCLCAHLFRNNLDSHQILLSLIVLLAHCLPKYIWIASVKTLKLLLTNNWTSEKSTKNMDPTPHSITRPTMAACTYI